MVAFIREKNKYILFFCNKYTKFGSTFFVWFPRRRHHIATYTVFAKNHAEA